MLSRRAVEIEHPHRGEQRARLVQQLNQQATMTSRPMDVWKVRLLRPAFFLAAVNLSSPERDR